MTWHKRYVITQWKKFFTDRMNKRVKIATRKICTADGPLKQYIANKRQPLTRMKKYHVAWRVPRRMQHLQSDIAKSHGIAIV